MKKNRLFYIIFLSVLLVMQSTLCWAKNRPESFDGRGYVGTLPDLTRDYEPAEPAQSAPEVNKAKDFNSENEIKPVPRDNPAFVNIILKQDKTSQYVNDLNEFIPILEKIYDLIEDESNVQIFNAKVY